MLSRIRSSQPKETIYTGEPTLLTRILEFFLSDVLFILKRRHDYSSDTHYTKSLSTGLFNSANFMNDMLNAHGISSEIEVAIDNNCIDRLVRNNGAKQVIIEAFWVVPSKFAVLAPLHKDVTWIIRIHSDMPFLAGEGMSMDWIGDYSCHPNIVLAPNSPRMYDEVRTVLKAKHRGITEAELRKKVVYLPNYYPTDMLRKPFDKDKDHIDIGCFGAVRPLKNHLTQAVAAIKFADSIGKELHFHINVGRIEGRGEPAMNNLKSLFEQVAPNHKLVGHGWMDHAEFTKVCAQMDIGMQVSFSETFNIVGADLIDQGVPIVASYGEIPWASQFFAAHPTEGDSIVRALKRTYRFPEVNVILNQHKLRRYSDKTARIWLEYFGDKL